MAARDKTLIAAMGFKDPDKADSKHDLACQYMTRPETLRRLVLMVEPRASDLGKPAQDGTYDTWLVQSGGPRRFEKTGTAEDGVPGVFRGTISYESVSRANCEVVLCRGEGQYRRPVGYLDVVADVDVIRRVEGQFTCDRWRLKQRHSVTALSTPPVFTRPSINPRDVEQIEAENGPVTVPVQFEEYVVSKRIYIEVKTGARPIGDILRQVKLYRDIVQDIGHARYARGSVAWIVATTYDMGPADRAMLTAEKIAHVKLGADFEEFCRNRDEEFASGDEQIDI